KTLAVAHSSNGEAGVNKLTLWDTVPSPTNSGDTDRWSAATLTPLIDLAFSPDGTRIAGGPQNSNQIQVWDAKTGIEVIRLGAKTDSKRHLFVAFAPNGKTIAPSGETGVALWDME